MPDAYSYRKFPDNYNPDSFYNTPEIFMEMPEHVLLIYKIDIKRYMISNWGRVYDKYKNVYLPQNIRKTFKNDYIHVDLKNEYNENVYVIMHRLMAAAYFGIVAFGKPAMVNHKDGVKWHNEISNLEWSDIQLNTIHAYDTGLNKAIAENHPNSALTDDQYRQICELTEQGYYPREINKIMNLGFNISKIASNIRGGQSERSIRENYDFSNIPRANYNRFSEEDVIKICKGFNSGLSTFDIIKDILNIDIDQLNTLRKRLLIDRVDNIKNRITFTNITDYYLI